MMNTCSLACRLLFGRNYRCDKQCHFADIIHRFKEKGETLGYLYFESILAVTSIAFCYYDWLNSHQGNVVEEPLPRGDTIAFSDLPNSLSSVPGKAATPKKTLATAASFAASPAPRAKEPTPSKSHVSTHQGQRASSPRHSRR